MSDETTRADEELEQDLDLDLFEDPDDDAEEAPPTEEKDIETVFGRNKGHEQGGKWFFCWQMGQPGDFIRDLGPKAELKLARVPNDKYTNAYDALVAKYERRGRGVVPKKILRKELPKLYAQFIFVGMKMVRFQGKYLADTQKNREMLLFRYQPDLMDSIYRHAEDLHNFQDVAVEDDYKPEFLGEEQEAALGNA